MNDRLSCCVPFCRRTYHNREGYQVWICSTHWRLTDKALRKARTDLFRRAKKRGWSNIRLQLEKENWHSLREQAIERAMGI